MRCLRDRKKIFVKYRKIEEKKLCTSTKIDKTLAFVDLAVYNTSDKYW